jgi:hypothetical protein
LFVGWPILRGKNREFSGIDELFHLTPSGFLDGFAVFLE